MRLFFVDFAAACFCPGLFAALIAIPTKAAIKGSGIGTSLRGFYGFINVASMVELPPGVTVIVRCQGVMASFSIET